MLLELVVSRKSVNTALNQDQSELGVLVLAVLLQVATDIDGLLDEVVQVLGDFRGHSHHLQYTQDLGSSDGLYLRYSVGVTKKHTDLRRRAALLCELRDLTLYLLGVSLTPDGDVADVGERRAGDTLSIAVHTNHDVDFVVAPPCARRP